MGDPAVHAPVNPISATLMYNGRVLIVAGSENDDSNEGGSYRNAIRDPTIPTQDAFQVSLMNYDPWCSDVAQLADGRPFIVGGTSDYTPPFWGDNRSSIYDPVTSTFLQTSSMVEGRWYATTTNPRRRACRGVQRQSDRRHAQQYDRDLRHPERRRPVVESAGQPLRVAPLYPRMFLLPIGKVFFTGQGSGGHLRSHSFDPGPQTWAASANTPSARGYGSAVLLPLLPPAYPPKVMNFGGNGLGSTETIDLGSRSPPWVAGPNMAAGRWENNAVLLPDGTVVPLGGSAVDRVPDEAGKRADVYDPKTNTMRSGGTASFARTYHSVALLRVARPRRRASARRARSCSTRRASTPCR